MLLFTKRGRGGEEERGKEGSTEKSLPLLSPTLPVSLSPPLFNL
jgi:hypothetical protein